MYLQINQDFGPYSAPSILDLNSIPSMLDLQNSPCCLKVIFISVEANLAVYYIDKSVVDCQILIVPLSMGVLYCLWFVLAQNIAVLRHFRSISESLLFLRNFVSCNFRFCYSNSLNQLPQWVQPHIRTYDKFGLVQRDLNLFFKNAAKEVGRGWGGVGKEARLEEKGREKETRGG